MTVIKGCASVLLTVFGVVVLVIAFAAGLAGNWGAAVVLGVIAVGAFAVALKL